jgi:hypothetical protein
MLDLRHESLYMPKNGRPLLVYPSTRAVSFTSFCMLHIYYGELYRANARKAPTMAKDPLAMFATAALLDLVAAPLEVAEAAPVDDLVVFVVVMASVVAAVRVADVESVAFEEAVIRLEVEEDVRVVELAEVEVEIWDELLEAAYAVPVDN